MDGPARYENDRTLTRPAEGINMFEYTKITSYLDGMAAVSV